MSIRFSPTSSLTSIYLTSDSPMLYSPSPYIPSHATVELYPSLPSITTTAPTWIAPGVVVPSFTTIQPQFPLDPRLDIDNDEKSKNIIAEYFYFKTIDKWLYDDMIKLLGYLKGTGSNIDIVDKLEDYNPKKTDSDTQENVENKIKFIEKNVLIKGDIYNILREYTRETNTKWADLVNKNSEFVKDIIKRKLKQKFEKMIGGKHRK